MRKTALIAASLAASALCAVPIASAQQTPVSGEATQGPRFTGDPVWIAGQEPDIRLEGIDGEDPVTLHSLRNMERWEDDGTGNWVRAEKLLHARAVGVPQDGVLELSGLTPIDGTFMSTDSNGLLWAGRREGTNRFIEPPAGLERPAAGIVRLGASRNGELLAVYDIELVNGPDDLIEMKVAAEGLAGAYAAPPGTGHPALIVLHGSEGASPGMTEATASAYAAQGFASLALAYFNQPYHVFDERLPTILEEIPIEQVETARDWLANRPEADASRIGIHGTSKGAEMALLAGVRYDWLDAVIACVGTDIVWEGGSVDYDKPAHLSSWTWGGEPLPFMRLLPFVEGQSLWDWNTDRYLASRKLFAVDEQAARIPVEDIAAPVLAIGGGRDHVWASGEMSKVIAETRGERPTTVLVNELAGHQICGTGTFPKWLYGDDSDKPSAKSIAAEGEAESRFWKAKIEWLREQLSED
ncbi:acyl-CoA thioester hydrolase/BAAT C-terminal domain-containing protein [Erythrobacter sp. NAP1]|uniref:acyl-CoA thioester hydrolase/BAAT C-terminal domain-containing protein n=1 Tax=Erythrobacter sp. NAP1 TaxID=237727 RepID=UPI0002F1B731|nr:acyl-CoA thioester hydrolase/BAAT C-terminal domain-containing protein [Erythrobacter sp. NAP1]